MFANHDGVITLQIAFWPVLFDQFPSGHDTLTEVRFSGEVIFRSTENGAEPEDTFVVAEIIGGYTEVTLIVVEFVSNPNWLLEFRTIV